MGCGYATPPAAAAWDYSSVVLAGESKVAATEPEWGSYFLRLAGKSKVGAAEPVRGSDFLPWAGKSESALARM